MIIGCTQKNLPIIKANSSKVSIRDGEEFKKDYWNLSPDLKPDIYNTVAKEKKRITFYTDIDSISYIVEPNNQYDFVILLNKKDSAFTRINVVADIPASSFTKNYILENKDKWKIEAPEVQELLLVVIALTQYGQEDSGLVNHETKYYSDVITYFEKNNQFLTDLSTSYANVKWRQRMNNLVKFTKTLTTDYQRLNFTLVGINKN